jgi:peroxiredoxin-like protein
MEAIMKLAQAHSFRSQLHWTGAVHGPTKDIKTDSREYEITMPGRQVIAGSAAPGFLGDPERTNPEELFLASISACQMLTYLALAARAKIEVTAYSDDSEAALTMEDGKWRISTVTLRPPIEMASGDRETALTLVEKAHKHCFITRSINCEVLNEPEIVEKSS